jgi:uncharacterized protein YydD (DUF2326 family)
MNMISRRIYNRKGTYKVSKKSRIDIRNGHFTDGIPVTCSNPGFLGV